MSLRCSKDADAVRAQGVNDGRTLARFLGANHMLLIANLLK